MVSTPPVSRSRGPALTTSGSRAPSAGVGFSGSRNAMDAPALEIPAVSVPGIESQYRLWARGRQARLSAETRALSVGAVPLARMHLDGHVRERRKASEPLAVEGGRARRRGRDRYDGADMARSEPPQMEVAQKVAVALDRHADILRHGRIMGHVEQNPAGVAYQRIGPARDHDRAKEACQRIHPDPSQKAGEQEPEDDQHRDGRIRDHVDHRGAQVVVAMSAIVRQALAMGLMVIIP